MPSVAHATSAPPHPSRRTEINERSAERAVSKVKVPLFGAVQRKPRSGAGRPPQEATWSSPAYAVEPFTVTGSTLPRSLSVHTGCVDAQTLGTSAAPQD